MAELFKNKSETPLLVSKTLCENLQEEYLGP